MAHERPWVWLKIKLRRVFISIQGEPFWVPQPCGRWGPTFFMANNLRAEALLGRAQMASDQESLDHVAREILIRRPADLESEYVFHKWVWLKIKQLCGSKLGHKF